MPKSFSILSGAKDKSAIALLVRKERTNAEGEATICAASTPNLVACCRRGIMGIILVVIEFIL